MSKREVELQIEYPGGALVLTRKEWEGAIISLNGEIVEVVVTNISENKAKLAFRAPRSVRIDRIKYLPES